MTIDADMDLLWQPSASVESLKKRARIVSAIRAFFAARGVLEVETPALGRTGNPDPAVEPFRVQGDGPGPNYLLHTSPEFPMKRLVAAGSGPIFQICRVFRKGESGLWHEPEFSMLEWYRPDWDAPQLMAEIRDLLGTLNPDWSQPGAFHSITYRRLFLHYLDFDPFLASTDEIQNLVARVGISYTGSELDRDDWLNLILTHRLETHLGQDGPCFLTDYPVSQAALAKIRSGDPPVAERFELYIKGVEIANGYHELTDPREQRRRFQEGNGARKSRNLAEMPLDPHLIAALDSGMPDCSGVALGVDRLVALLLGYDRLAPAISFGCERY